MAKKLSFININPNVMLPTTHMSLDMVFLRRQIGKFINDARVILRHNPKLGNAIAMALPGATAFYWCCTYKKAMMTLLRLYAIAAAAASPTLIDEALASKNALAIMNDAGLRANIGQRGRLAGGFLSYLAPVLISGSLGNALGNVSDDYTALYDL